MQTGNGFGRWFVLATLVCVLLLVGCSGGGGGGNGGDQSGNDGDITADRFGGAGTGDGKFGNSPRGIAIDEDGMVYVSDTANDRIQKFTANGVFIKKWDCAIPYGLVTYNERLYVCSIPDRVMVFDLEGTPIDTWEAPDVNDRSGGMAVVDIDVDQDGILYVLDNIDRAVKKFSDMGAYLGSFRVDTVDDWVWGPLGIAVSGRQVFVTDAANHKVNVWDINGTYVRSWGIEGDKNGEFYAPTGIVVVKDRSLIIGDINLAPTFARLQRFSLTGNYQATAQPDLGNFYPTALAVNPAGDKIYICYARTFEIRIIDMF